MPFRLDEFRAKIQFVTSARMPSLIDKACGVTGTVSQTRYLQEAACEKLARDLGIPLQSLIAELPPPKGRALVRNPRVTNVGVTSEVGG